MTVSVKKFLEETDISESFYPGKRLVKKLKQTGEYKSHCIVMDWREPGTVRLDVKAGLSGRQLDPKDLKAYPVCFQSPTYVEIDIANDDDEDDDEEGKKGKSGGGGKKMQKKKKSLDDIEMISDRFGDSVEGQVPDEGKIVDMVVMGMKIAKEAYESVFSQLTAQIKHAKISSTELLAKAGSMVTRVQPPSFLKPTGDETAQYSYDREKNADIGMRPGFG